MGMSEMSKFYEALSMVTSLTKEQQDRFISEVKDLQRQSVINELNIGTVVRINHKKISPMDQFRITKINRKNVKCQKLNSSTIYTVTPSLLEVIK
jgi:hypothetical protein